jgi:hypothetical protein
MALGIYGFTGPHQKLHSSFNAKLLINLLQLFEKLPYRRNRRNAHCPQVMADRGHVLIQARGEFLAERDLARVRADLRHAT